MRLHGIITLLITMLLLPTYTKADEHVFIYDGTRSIPADATAVEIAASVDSIPSFLFAGHTALERVTFAAPSSVKKICDRAFYGAENLIEIPLPESLLEIGEGAFCGCTSLIGITIPGHVSSIPKYCFAWCGSLINVDLPDKLTEISSHAFAYCRSLQEIRFPESLRSIGNNAFSRCSSLISVSLPGHVTLLESYAFSDCPSLVAATLPANDAVLGELIFSCCTSLERINQPSVSPPLFDCDSFIFEPDDHEAYSRCLLIVPHGTAQIYRNAPGWKLFRHITYISNFKSDSE